MQEKQRARLQGRNVGWYSSPSDVPRSAAGCVFANEVVDNLPVDLVERHRGTLHEVRVGVADGRLAMALAAPRAEVTRCVERMEAHIEEGQRVEVPVAAERFVRDAASVFKRGALILVDYGIESVDLAERPRGTLVTYWSGGIGEDPLVEPGGRDITAHANWTVIHTACEGAGLDIVGPRPQGDVLRLLGLSELDQDLARTYSTASASGRGAQALRSMSRRHALRVLADPGGLGALGVLAGTRGFPATALCSAVRGDP